MSGPNKRWYAMRKRLKEQGSWKGKTPAHKVPAQEEGEPPTKQPRAEAPENPEQAVQEGAGSDPEEGTSKAAQGKICLSCQCIPDKLWLALEAQVDLLSWLGSIPRPGDLKAWMKSNALIRSKKCSKTALPYFVEDGGWMVPLWKIAGIHTHSSPVPVLWLVQRPLFGL